MDSRLNKFYWISSTQTRFAMTLHMVNLQAVLRFAIYFLLPVCLMLFLSSCSHVRRDGPPNFYVDETKIPNAKPKKEPLAKYGNMNSYRVNGKRYYVMKSSKNYDAVGVASWYGTLFHGQRASSGERYDMLGMTAAHKTLPLPTYVEVTNLQNHRKIIVKVNDRGPFRNDRLIDLSYVAAKKLGMLGHGTARVEVKAIDPNTYGRASHMIAHKHTKSFMAANHTTQHGNPDYIQPAAITNHSKPTIASKTIKQLAKTSRSRQIAASRNRRLKTRRLKLVGSKSDKETGV